MKKNNKQRLFEMMNKVAGMSLMYEDINTKPNLPTWASSLVNDFIPKEKYEKLVPCTTDLEEVERELYPPKTELDDMQNLLRHKDYAFTDRIKQDVEGGGRLSPLMQAQTRIGDYGIELGKTPKTLTDKDKEVLRLPKDYEGDVEYDLEKLSQILTQRPIDVLGQNTKMGKTNFYNITLPALTGIFYDIDAKKFYVINVCKNAHICKKICFAQLNNFVKNDPTIRKNAQKLNYLLNRAETWKNEIIRDINGLVDGNSRIVIRWHDSGDFFSEEYMKLAFEIARETEFTEHYAYTKEIGTAKGLKPQQPPNFEFKFSFGGLQDHLIDKENDGHAVVVPPEIFRNLQPDVVKFDKKTGRKIHSKGWNFTSENIQELKKRISQTYNIDINTILTNKELAKIPYNMENPRKWNVIGITGEGDMPALRRDVLGVYILQHK